MNVLITGGAGFIGSHLAERCLREGFRVAVLDDLSSGSAGNIAHLAGNADFEFVTGSVLDERLVARMVDRCDLVFHLAAAVGVRRIVESPLRTIETNVGGTEAVLKAAAPGRKRVIVASTSEVYGKSAQVPFSEDGDLVIGSPQKGRWSYACSKALDEFLGLAYYHEHEVPVSVVRLFNTVGPRQQSRFGMVMPRFVQQALANAPITVYGDGSQRRCFNHVPDAVEALMRIAVSDACIGEIVNVGNDREISIGALANLVRAKLGSDSPVVHVTFEEVYGPRFEDMPRRVPSLEKLRRLTGLRPATTIETMIDSVAGSLRARPLRVSGRAADSGVPAASLL